MLSHPVALHELDGFVHHGLWAQDRVTPGRHPDGRHRARNAPGSVQPIVRGGELEEEVRGEMHTITGRPAQEVRHGSSGRFPDDVEAGDLKRALHPRLSGEEHAKAFKMKRIYTDEALRCRHEFGLESCPARHLPKARDPVVGPHLDDAAKRKGLMTAEHIP